MKSYETTFQQEILLVLLKNPAVLDSTPRTLVQTAKDIYDEYIALVVKGE